MDEAALFLALAALIPRIEQDLLGMTRDQLYAQVRRGMFPGTVYVPSQRQWYITAESAADCL